MSEGRNRLGAEKSPYLLQHRDNPVWWYPWGPEAFAAAAAADRPVFLSIGYSTCHWCHVMEHQSFEDPQVAALLNDGFIAIKVDREERPDVDAIYMDVTQALTGHGGWPMSVWLTPEARPFFAGTYFPREAFVDLLVRIRQAWTARRGEIESQGHALAEAVRQRTAAGRAGTLDDAVIRTFVDGWRGRFDPRHGGTR
nr:thioredoxin domain-containing protein [Acidobacteriota bacterium]